MTRNGNRPRRAVRARTVHRDRLLLVNASAGSVSDLWCEWPDRRGPSQNALADLREEMLDHERYVDMGRAFRVMEWMPPSQTAAQCVRLEVLQIKRMKGSIYERS